MMVCLCLPLRLCGAEMQMTEKSGEPVGITEVQSRISRA